MIGHANKKNIAILHHCELHYGALKYHGTTFWQLGYSDGTYIPNKLSPSCEI